MTDEIRWATTAVTVTVDPRTGRQPIEDIPTRYSLTYRITERRSR